MPFALLLLVADLQNCLCSRHTLSSQLPMKLLCSLSLTLHPDCSCGGTEGCVIVAPATIFRACPAYLTGLSTAERSFLPTALSFLNSVTPHWLSSMSLIHFILVFETSLLASSSGLGLWPSFLCYFLEEWHSSSPGVSDCFMTQRCGQLTVSIPTLSPLVGFQISAPLADSLSPHGGLRSHLMPHTQ